MKWSIKIFKHLHPDSYQDCDENFYAEFHVAIKNNKKINT